MGPAARSARKIATAKVNPRSLISGLSLQVRLGHIMVFILDGCSFDYAHTWRQLGISICWRHLVTSKESSNPIFFSEKDLIFIIRAQR